MRRSTLSVFGLAFVAASALAMGVPTPARGAKIYAIFAADTLDSRIGKSVMADLRSIEGAFSLQVRQDLLDIRSISGVECSPEAILGAVDASAAGADDTLVVYFSGHGAWDPRLGPYLKFPRLDERRQSLTRDRIKQKMQAKGCRLAVLLTDTCNKVDKIKVPPEPAFPRAMPPGARPAISVLFRALFLDTVGLVDLTSSQQGELSLAYPALQLEVGPNNNLLRALGETEIHRGGLFTGSLVSTFLASQDRPLTWREVADQTARTVRAEFRKLKPNGLDNEDEPEKPQMTQTVVALSVGTVQRRPLDLPVGEAGWTMGVFGFDNEGGGVYVWATKPGGAAAGIGLERGDVIVAIDGANVAGVRDYRDAIARSNGSVQVDFRNIRTGQVERSEARLARGVGPDAGAPGRPIFGVAGVEAPGGGIRVTQVVPGSPAALVGVDLGDVIREINGNPVPNLDAYYREVRQSDAEMRFTVVNVRNGQSLGMIVPLDRDAPPGPRAGGWTFGVHGFENAGRGLIVWATRPNSPAARLGLERGDLILTIDGADIQNVGIYQNAIARSNGRIALTYQDIRDSQVKQAEVALDRGAGPGAAAGHPVFGASCIEVDGRGFQVAALVPNSPAALVDLDVGDQLLEINGRAVRTQADYIEAIRQSDDEMRFTVLNVRTGQPLGMIVQLDR